MAITSYKAVVGYYNGAGTPNITTAVTGQLSDGWIPIGSPILTDAYGQCTQMMAKTDAVPVIATSAYTVVTAANPQPPDATWDAQGEPLWIDTATYLQAYTKGGAYLQGTVPVSRGGTGATTTLAAAANLQVFSISNNLSEIVNRTAAWLNVRPTGPLPLGGDPVSDYDAATKRWVQNLINTGTVGPTMNGVMNYGVGDFHLRDSRAFIQPYEVVADGQLLNRADWPELWAYAQMLSPISDADWLADPTKRGKYSLGNGTTTFRVPDRNGVQSGSVSSLFARGDGGNSTNNGLVYKAAVPNITGSVRVAGGDGGFVGGTGSLTTYNGANMAYYNPAGNSVNSNRVYLDASISDRVYGRDNIADDVLPRNFVGVWVIRASGGFVAANTSWSVKNADATSPVPGVTVNGGMIKSTYKIGTAVNYETLSYSFRQIGGNATTRGHQLVLQDAGVTERTFSFTADGAPASSGTSGNYQFVTSAVSDANMKHDITPATVDKAWSNIKALRFNTFVYNNDTQGRQRRGLVAQQAEVVDSLYVKTRTYSGLTSGTPDVTQKELDTTPLLLDTMHVVQTLMAKVEALEAEIAALKSGK